MSEEKQAQKASSVRHTRAVQKNRVSQPVAAPTDVQIQERIQEIVHPVTLAQASYFHRLGLRERTDASRAKRGDFMGAAQESQSTSDVTTPEQFAVRTVFAGAVGYSASDA